MRKKEIEDLIKMFTLRIEAEVDYSMKLFEASKESTGSSDGIIFKEIESFKANCRSKAKAAQELA